MDSSAFPAFSCRCRLKHSYLFSLQNHRVAKQLMVVIRMQGDTRVSRFCALSRYDAQKMCNDAFALIQNCNMAGAHQAAW